MLEVPEIVYHKTGLKMDLKRSKVFFLTLKYFYKQANEFIIGLGMNKN